MKSAVEQVRGHTAATRFRIGRAFAARGSCSRSSASDAILEAQRRDNWSSGRFALTSDSGVDARCSLNRGRTRLAVGPLVLPLQGVLSGGVALSEKVKPDRMLETRERRPRRTPLGPKTTVLSQ